MKKLLLALVATLVLSAGIVSAQSEQDGLTLDTTYEIPELGFNLTLPSGWVRNSLNTFAPSEEILANYSDGDDATPITGLVVTVLSAPLEALALEPTAPLESVVDGLAVTLTEKEARSETSILGRRTLVAFGTSNTGGGDGILGVWTQGELVVLLVMVVPTDESYLDYAYEYGQILGGIRPNKGEDILQVITEEITNVSVNIPEDWTYKAYPDLGFGAAFANSDDVSVVETNEGALQDVVVFFLKSTYADYGLEAEATTADLNAALETILFNPKFDGEFLVNGLAGVAYYNDTTDLGEEGTQNYSVFTLNPEDQTVNFYSVRADSAEIIAENLGTFQFILSLIKPVE